MAASLGHVVYLLGMLPARWNRPVGQVAQLVAAATHHQFIRVLFGPTGQPVACVIWAFPSPEVQRRLAENPNYVLHESEWDEGGSLWILDMIAPFGNLRQVLRELRQTTFARQSLVQFAHDKPARGFRQVVSRRLAPLV